MASSKIKVKTSPLSESIAWHQNLAVLASKSSDSSLASTLNSDADKLEKKINEAVEHRKPEIRLKAAELKRQMQQKRFQAGYASRSVDAASQLKHLLTAVQLKAAEAKSDPTVAAYDLISSLKSEGSDEMKAAIKKDKTAIRFGLAA